MGEEVVEVNGARLAYDEAGVGDAMVLLHAGIADRRMWDSVMAAFSARYRVVRGDVRGYGQSTLPAAPFSYAADIIGLLDAIEIDRAILVGASMGGATALDVALQAPKRVEALVLAAPGLGGSEPSAEMQAAWARIDSILERDGVAAAVEAELRLWVDGLRRSPDQVNPTVREAVRVMNTAIYEAVAPDGAVRQRLAPPAAERLDELRVPTLVIVGDGDVPDMLTNASAIARGISGARLVTLPDVAHLPSMERPAEFVGLVLDFLDRRMERT